jgi:hypothetical protein
MEEQHCPNFGYVILKHVWGLSFDFDLNFIGGLKAMIT